ncbi:MAG: DNA repair protein RecO [Clostridia bacterium]|nr:DNA repair protein RecO [Clostridia bacterium]
MSLITTDGLIIKEQKVGESDRLVTILTRDKGIVRAFAPHALKFKSKNLTATQLLCYSRLTLYKSRDTYKVNDASSIQVFFKLRNDISALSLAGYFCELLMQLAPEEDNADDFLRLMLNCLHLLCEDKRPKELIKAIAELKFCQLAGYMPDVINCAKCQCPEPQSPLFDVKGGNIYCSECGTVSPTTIPIPNSVLAAMRHILYAESSKLFAFNINEQSQQILSLITERFVETQTERNYNTLDFYKSVRE